MNKHLLTTLILASLSMTANAQQWPEVQQEAKAGARWWWLGSAVDKENLRWNMQEYANHGIGALEITPIYGVQGNDALEITPIYGVQGNEANNIPYLSDRWMEMLREVQKNGLELGIEVDMATGTGWPFGGPWVPLEESASKAVFVDTTFIGNSIQCLNLQAPEKDAPYCRLDKVMAYWRGEPYDVTAYMHDGKLTWSPAEQLKAQIKTVANNTLKKALKLQLKEMETAQWRVVAVYCRFGVMKVKRAAPGGMGLVIDHFDKKAVSNYLQHIEDAFERTKWRQPLGRPHFLRSLRSAEVTNWRITYANC